jgi:hypothetical protein
MTFKIVPSPDAETPGALAPDAYEALALLFGLARRSGPGPEFVIENESGEAVTLAELRRRAAFND